MPRALLRTPQFCRPPFSARVRRSVAFGDALVCKLSVQQAKGENEARARALRLPSVLEHTLNEGSAPNVFDIRDLDVSVIVSVFVVCAGSPPVSTTELSPSHTQNRIES